LFSINKAQKSPHAQFFCYFSLLILINISEFGEQEEPNEQSYPAIKAGYLKGIFSNSSTKIY